MPGGKGTVVIAIVRYPVIRTSLQDYYENNLISMVY